MKNALLLTGGWAGHQPEAMAGIFAPLLESEGFRVEVSASLEILADGERMRAKDLVVPVWTMSKIEEPQEKGLLAAVEAGTGLAGFHGGMCDAFRESTHYQFMTGGQFVDHPGGILDYAVRIAKPQDPIVKGLSGFTVRSEQYYMHVDPAVEVLATTRFDGRVMPWIDGATMPAAWKKRWGAGRVFFASWGHAPEEFKIPQALEIVKRGMLWASR